MLKRSNAPNIDALWLENEEHKREKSSLYDELDVLRNQNMMLLESLRAITQDDTFWSEDALRSGIVFKLKNVLTQIENNYQ
tara:strand:- start:102 stop:344 length:243 start_codon:yes stop_codon:yes gene_type:complete